MKNETINLLPNYYQLIERERFFQKILFIFCLGLVLICILVHYSLQQTLDLTATQQLKINDIEEREPNKNNEVRSNTNTGLATLNKFALTGLKNLCYEKIEYREARWTLTAKLDQLTDMNLLISVLKKQNLTAMLLSLKEKNHHLILKIVIR